MMKLHNLHFSFNFWHPVYGTKCSVWKTKEGYFYTGEPDDKDEFHYICSPESDPKMALSERFF